MNPTVINKNSNGVNNNENVQNNEPHSNPSDANNNAQRIPIDTRGFPPSPFSTVCIYIFIIFYLI